MARSLETVSVKDIDDSQYQTRLSIDPGTIGDLVQSVRRDGILVPLLLSYADEKYTVVAGHRRFLAACEIGLPDVPAYVMLAGENKGWSGAFAENMFRQDLTSIEEASAIVDCLASGQYDAESMAKALGKSRAWVEDRVMISSWPGDTQEAVHAGRVSLAAARNLAKIDDPVHRQMLTQFAYENGASARSTAA